MGFTLAQTASVLTAGGGRKMAVRVRQGDRLEVRERTPRLVGSVEVD